MQGSHLRLSNVSNGSFGGQGRSILSYFLLLTHSFRVSFAANTAARMHSAVRSSHGKRGRAPKPRKHAIKMFSFNPIVPHILLKACVALDYYLGSLQAAQYCPTQYCLTCSSDMSDAFCASTAGSVPSCVRGGQNRNTVMLWSNKSGVVLSK